MSSAPSKTYSGDVGNDWVIVGGGVHGTHIAQRLIDSGVERSRLAIVERTGELLGNFREKLRKARVDSLRSPYVHHVGTEPFSLESYAKATGREDELLPTLRSPRRPTTDLFLDHADHVIESRSLDELVVEAEVTGVSRRGDGSLGVRTDGGRLSTDRILLAVGNLGVPNTPDWSEELDAGSIGHVWGNGVDDVENSYVVGGGTTACSVAVWLARETGDVTLVSRHELRKAAVESDPKWLNWKHIEKELHGLPPASEARYERVKKARNDGTVPHHLAREVENEREEGRLEMRRGDIEAALPLSDDGVKLRFADGGAETAARVVLATGFGDVYRHPLVRRIAESLGFARGYRGMPVLDDDSLAWKRHDGSGSGVHVTGRLAEGVLGAFARNVATARRAGDRLTKIGREKLEA